MLQSDLSLYTHEQLSQYTHQMLSNLSSLGEEYVTDRTSADVERWRALRNKGWANMTDDERQEWMGVIVPTPAASKGMYTYRDLNRVETAVEKTESSFDWSRYRPIEHGCKNGLVVYG